MFIIYGSRALTKKINEGQFYCPNCDDVDIDYEHKTSRQWFTLYWIPIFPVGSAIEFIECCECKQTFQESVLDIEPPTAEERLASEYDDKLDRGYSLEACQESLVDDGMTQDQARDYLEKLVGKDMKYVWKCKDCGERYLEEVVKCKPCSKRNDY